MPATASPSANPAGGRESERTDDAITSCPRWRLPPRCSHRPGAGRRRRARAHHAPPSASRSHVSLHVSDAHRAERATAWSSAARCGPSGAPPGQGRRPRPRGRRARARRRRRNGDLRAALGPARTGTYAVRAYGVHDRRRRGSESVARQLTVYRHAGASYYGPGLYGNGVACGGTLMPGTLGVAHKTLPCGTKVKLRYHGRSVTVPVIDRGPYVAGRDYDLTEATKERLGFPGVGTVLASR